MTATTVMPAMVLAAGRGERMRPLTDTVPKPLLEVGGKPLIAWHLERLAAAGFTKIVINTAYRGAQIEERIGDGSAFGLHVRYSREGEPALDTGGGIRHALPLLGPGPFMVVNGDVFTDYPFATLRKHGLQQGDLAHLVMVANPSQHPRGDFSLRDGRLGAEEEPRLTYSGIGLYRAELVAGEHPPRFPLAPLLVQAMQAGKVGGEFHDGQWDDIGTPARLQALNQRLAVGNRGGDSARVADG